MTGMDKSTGRALSGTAHLAQSVADILTTPVGSRVMRRDYGSRLFELIDTPVTPSSAIDYAAATADALGKWEPRVSYSRCSLSTVIEGKVSLTVFCAVKNTGAPFSLTLSLAR